MKPIISDQDTGHQLWLASDCAAHCGVTPSTWRSYNRTGGTMNPPLPVAHLDKRTPLWDADEVRQWHTTRPGSPIKTTP